MLSVRMIEACEDESKGSLGCHYVMNSMRESGYKVDYINNDSSDDNLYDVELISVHHVSDFPKVLGIKKRAKIRIIGGHPMQNNPLPLINHADVLCIGEAETWIKEAFKRLSADLNIDSLKDLGGALICNDWNHGDKVPVTQMEKTVPNNDPVLSKKSVGHAATWYIEIGRGCPFSCAYCELGHSVKARMRSVDSIKEAIAKCDINVSKKLTLFAPDEASHRHYGDILEYLHKKGFITQFGSMRLDQILRKKNIPFKANMLIRVGIDGLSESIRMRVNKKLTDNSIIEYFYYMFENGHTNFKIFQVFSYSFETDDDWDAWVALFDMIKSYYFKKNVMMRIKFTPFIPQPITPLGNEKPAYNARLMFKIKQWAVENKKPKNGRKGIYLDFDGVMGKKEHAKQCELAVADENIDLMRFA